MFRRIDPARPSLGTLVFEGRTISICAGDTVATALLAAGISRFREHPCDGTHRAPLCMMGVCFECLVEIDGVQNQQACMIVARPGMMIRAQAGAARMRRNPNV